MLSILACSTTWAESVSSCGAVAWPVRRRQPHLNHSELSSSLADKRQASTVTRLADQMVAASYVSRALSEGTVAW